jgi:hypothetical protein
MPRPPLSRSPRDHRGEQARHSRRVHGIHDAVRLPVDIVASEVGIDDILSGHCIIRRLLAVYRRR